MSLKISYEKKTGSILTDSYHKLNVGFYRPNNEAQIVIQIFNNEAL